MSKNEKNNITAAQKASMCSVITEELLTSILCAEPKDPMKGRGNKREILKVQSQKLNMDIVKHFFECVPESHKAQMYVQNVYRKLLSPEAWLLWKTFEKNKCAEGLDYETLYAFEQI